MTEKQYNEAHELMESIRGTKNKLKFLRRCIRKVEKLTPDASGNVCVTFDCPNKEIPIDKTDLLTLWQSEYALFSDELKVYKEEFAAL